MHSTRHGRVGRFSGKTAVITGGSSGLGKAIADRLHGEGAAVEIWDVDTASASDRQFRDDASWFTAKVDVSDPAVVADAADQTVRRLGRIDLLVNSAGLEGPFCAAEEYPLQDWHKVVAVNLTGTYLCCREIIPGMKSQGYGRILNIASIAGKEGNPLQVAYVAAKAGIIGMTKTLGKELAPTGITVNAVAPAVFDTPLTAHAAGLNPESVERLKEKIPMNRMGRLDEMASLATWILSEECSFTTGFTFDASGGRCTY